MTRRLSQTPAARAARKRSRSEAEARQVLGFTKAQWDGLRRKRRRTAADALSDRMKHMQAHIWDLGVAARTAMSYRIGRMIDKAALSEKDRGALELMSMILDETETPGVLYERLRQSLVDRRDERDQHSQDQPEQPDS